MSFPVVGAESRAYCSTPVRVATTGPPIRQFVACTWEATGSPAEARALGEAHQLETGHENISVHDRIARKWSPA